jgi:hypothetical protein
MILKSLENHSFKINVFIILCVSIFIFSDISIFAQSIDDTQVVLTIGDATITKYEFEKNLNIFKADFIRRNNFNPSSKDVEKSIQSFIDHTYFLADAYQKGFDTLNEVNKRVTSMAHLIISQPGGLLDKKMTDEKLSSDDSNEIRRALQFASKRIIVEYLKFNNYEQAVNFVGGFDLKGYKEFDDVVRKNAKSHQAIYKTDTLKWPFSLFRNETDMVAGLKSNEVTPLFALSDGYYLMHIRDIQVLSASEMNNIKKQVIALFTFKEEEKVREQFQKEIEEKAQIVINKVIMFQLEKFLKNHGALHEFDKASLSDLLQANIMSYKANNKLIDVSVDQFVSYYNYLPLKTEIKDSSDVVYYLKSMVFDYYAYKKAREYGLTQRSKFLLNKENYKNEIIYALYGREVLSKGISASNEEVKKAYDLNKSKFIQATDVIISIYYFNDINNAILGMMRIKQGNVDASNLQGLDSSEINKRLNYQSDFFSDSIKSLIFDLKINEVSRPILINGKFMVVLKESESGKRIENLDEVKNFLVKKIKDRKLSERKKAYLLKLKSLYPIKNEIDYQKYLTVSKSGR